MGIEAMGWEPAVPERDAIGRLSCDVPLVAGWPCRWCSRPLRRLPPRGHVLRGNEVACTNCDDARGYCP